jgi:hypothetical protein
VFTNVTRAQLGGLVDLACSPYALVNRSLQSDRVSPVASEQQAMPVVIRASPLAISQATGWIGWLALPWAFAVLFGGSALIDRLGLGTDTPLALRLSLVVVALTPGAVRVTSPWLGRLPGMRWLLASPQPEARLDIDHLTLILPDREPVRFDWSEITGMQPANDFRRSAHLLGSGGAVLATIPYELAHPRRWRTSRSFAQEVVEARPDRYVVTGTNVVGVADRIALRETASAISDIDPVRRQAIVFTVLVALLGGFGIVVAVWFAIGAKAG